MDHNWTEKKGSHSTTDQAVTVKEFSTLEAVSLKLSMIIFLF